MTRMMRSTARGMLFTLATLAVLSLLSQSAMAQGGGKKGGGGGYGGGGGGYGGGGGGGADVPEIDPAAATGALTLLVTGLAMYYQPRRKTA